MHRRLRLAVLGTAIGTLLALAPGGMALAADPPLEVVMHARPDNCVEATANQPFHVQLRDKDGDPLADADAAPIGDEWIACLGQPVKPGHRLIASAPANPEAGEVSFRIPRFTVRTDRAKDIVRGDVPKGKQLRIRLFDCVPWGDDCPLAASRTVTGDKNGHYSKDFTSIFAFRGRDLLQVRYRANAGHTYTLSPDIPVFVAEVGSVEVRGSQNPGGSSKFRLIRTSDGDVLSRRTAHSEPGDTGFSIEFGSNVRSNRTIKADFATDATMVVPDMTVTQTTQGGHVLLKTRCQPNRRTRLQWTSGEVIVRANGNGRVVADLTDLGQTPPDGAAVEVRCDNKGGDLLIAP